MDLRENKCAMPVIFVVAAVNSQLVVVIGGYSQLEVVSVTSSSYRHSDNNLN